MKRHQILILNVDLQPDDQTRNLIIENCRQTSAHKNSKLKDRQYNHKGHTDRRMNKKTVDRQVTIITINEKTNRQIKIYIFFFEWEC
jgi:hypothetical protein